jgi:hypothetical protein
MKRILVITLSVLVLLTLVATVGLWGPLLWRGNVRSLGEAVVFESVAEVKQRLLDGEPVDARDSARRTPLETAIIFDKPEMVMLLLENGADPNQRTVRGAHDGTDCLGLLLSENLLGDSVSPEQLSLMAAKITDLNRPQGVNDTTPLYDVLLHNRVDLAAVLVEHGADINARNGQGSGGHGRTPIFACLGLQGTAEDGPMGGTTALQWALEHGADPQLPLDDGRTALDLVWRDDDRALLRRHAAEFKGAAEEPATESTR